MIIEGAIKRDIDVAHTEVPVDIPFMIDTSTGTYSQWGHDTVVLGQNVELLEALRDAACELGTL